VSDYETYIVEIGSAQGRRYSKRLPLNAPLHVATEEYERLSDLALRDTIHDLQAEQQRRQALAVRRHEVAEACGDYDPFASQHRGGSA
jgi:hypothetical protein